MHESYGAQRRLADWPTIEKPRDFVHKFAGVAAGCQPVPEESWGSGIQSGGKGSVSMFMPGMEACWCDAWSWMSRSCEATGAAKIAIARKPGMKARTQNSSGL